MIRWRRVLAIGQVLQRIVARVARPVLARTIVFGPWAAVCWVHRPLVKPGSGQHRRREALLRQQRGECRSVPRHPPAGIAIEYFRVELLDHTEATELAFFAIPIAVVIAVLSGEPSIGNEVGHRDALDDLHGKRQRAAPTCFRPALIAKVGAGGGGVGHLGDCAEVVVHPCEQIGLHATREVEKVVVWRAVATGVPSPEQAWNARTQDV